MNPSDPSCRVLLIEDEALIAMSIEDTLAELGHEVVAVATRLDRAMELAQQAQLELAIVDINLNGEKTYPVAEILAARDIPFIFATGYGAPVLEEKWRHLPALQKPFQAQDLVEAIAAIRLRAAAPGASGEKQ
jgi:CheY-like chemotaxis protein